MTQQHLSRQELDLLQYLSHMNDVSKVKQFLNRYSSKIITNSLVEAIKYHHTYGLTNYQNLLLADHLDIDQPTSLASETPLYTATMKNSLWIVQDLVSKGANVNASCINGNYPLLVASTHFDSFNPTRFKIFEFLLENGANPNIITKSGDSCLTHCIRMNFLGLSPESISTLIKAGADINFLTPDNSSPLFLALDSASPNNISALCQSVTDLAQIDKFKKQISGLEDNSFYSFTINLLNNIELQIQLDSTLPTNPSTSKILKI